ncbi:MAG TPA: COX15/CtaA family protein [Roseiflexaceae bacterium]|nr:COX15/CtaA family protein [Roseiflexaceae bacterium]
MKQTRFAWFAWGVLVYNLLVIMWGAFVRATGSGAGCGEHWPVCNGQIIPRAPRIETIIEFSHRMTTGLAGFLVIALVVWAFRAFPRGHRVRWGAALTMLFIVLEGAVGAVQVKLGLVADNPSLSRALVGSIHLVNTFFLTGAMVLTAWWASGGAAPRLRGQGVLGVMLGVGLVAALLLGASGAVTALGDTLFPSTSFRAGFAQDFSPTAHFLIRLRVFHPVIAILVGIYTVLASLAAVRLRPSPKTRAMAYGLCALFFTQLLLGALNIYLLAPVWMQLVHLLFADLVWLFMVLLAASVLAQPAPADVPASVAHPAPSLN